MISEIDKSRYMKIDLPGINNITLEWDENKKKYTKLFKNIESLIEVTFTNFDTTEVTAISNMFINCPNLKYINFNNMNTSLVNDMTSMFENCSSLLSLDLSSFDTSNVIFMESMFKNCSSLIKTIEFIKFSNIKVNESQ